MKTPHAKALQAKMGKKETIPSLSHIRKSNPLFFSKATSKFFGDKKHTYNAKEGTYHVEHEHGSHTYKVDKKGKLNP